MTDFGALLRFQLGKSDSATDRAVRILLRDAYEHVPQVRDRFERAGLDSNAIRSREDLRKIPLISRDDVGALKAKDVLRQGADPDRCVVSWTSGTSGRQLAVHMSRAEAFYRKLLLYNAIRRNLHGLPLLSIAEAGAGSWKGPHTKRAVGIIRVIWVPRAAPIAEQAKQLATAKAAVITGHPSCLRLVAEQIRLEALEVRPRLVVCRGEVLEPSTRALLSEVFRCRVVDYYSCDEVGNIAWECPERPGVLHVNSDGCVVEIVDETGQVIPEGREGRVVLTNLYNRTMPFIRYDLGDRASVHRYDDHCHCGFRGTSLSPIAGREMQIFRMADGSGLSVRVLATVLNREIRRILKNHTVEGYQVIQNDLTSVRVRVCSPGDLPPEVLTKMSRGVEALNPAISCTVDVVDRLEPGPSGKFQRYIPYSP